MKRVLNIIAMFIIMIMLSGCGNKSKYSIECGMQNVDYSADYSDKIDITQNALGKFDKNGYLTYAEFKTIEEAMDEITYKDRKESSDDEGSADEEGIIYKVEYDDKNRKITIVTEIQPNYKDMTGEEKDALYIANYVRDLEMSGYSCKINGTSREKIGLED